MEDQRATFLFDDKDKKIIYHQVVRSQFLYLLPAFFLAIVLIVVIMEISR